ncbi:glycosyl transferase family 2 [Yasminevirus sp. GU-2018]|uniref:UDP-N-acetylglucosamine diphosphorylase n=1 Tax=Yasminevirus sp. GU-2018 TaxID=2420051 RepID=A0A5K0UB38_9VIRU|nr:glycosyl transferase family 2 [Yasminevirus sp. GU-2018]
MSETTSNVKDTASMNKRTPNRFTVIMAGGSGTRMKSVLPKPLITVGTKPMIVHLIDNVRSLGTEIVLIVSEKTKGVFVETLIKSNYVTHIKDDVYYRNGSIIHICVQPVSNGTGGALMATTDFFKSKNPDDTVLVLSGDVPLITKRTMQTMFNKIESDATSCVILAKDTDDNFGYGRVVTDTTPSGDRTFVKIVEQKDCNDEERKITFINTGTYAFRVGPLLRSFSRLNSNNSQKEYYLTDCPRIIKEDSFEQTNPIKLHVIDGKSNIYDETLGANTPEQLEQLRLEYLKKFRVDNILESDSNMSDENIRNLMRVLDQLSSKRTTTKLEDLDLNMIRHHVTASQNSTMNRKTTFIVKFEETVVGTASVLIEDKLIHDMGRASHIEDVVVDEEYRGLGLAKLLMLRLIEYSKEQRAYKIILDASDDVKGFYEKLGFKQHSNSMRMNIE